MRNRSVITLFQQMAERLESLVSMLGSVRLSITHAGATAHLATIQKIEQTTQAFERISPELDEALRNLRQRIDQLNLLYDITNQLNDQLSFDQVIEFTMDAMWQKAPLSFAVVILGDTEIGPYYYRNMRGVSDPWRFLGRECPFPLWGVLARALIPHLDPSQPDYLMVANMRAEHRPLQEEFPWMKLEGSLMILPLRTQKTVSGALLLGRNEVDGFRDVDLCEDYTEIAKSAARALQFAQIHQELQERVSQLVGLQLLTRSLTNIKSFDEVIQLLTQSIIEIAGKATVSVILDQQFVQRPMATQPFIQQSEKADFRPAALAIYALPMYENQKTFELSAQFSRLVEWAIQAGQPVFYDPSEPPESPEQFYYSEAGRGLLVPIMNNERTIGVIHVVADARAQRFDEGDMVILCTIANAAAMMLNHVHPTSPGNMTT